MEKSSSAQGPGASRRFFLASAWDWLRLAVIGALLYPLLRFVSMPLPKKPRKVKIDKVLLPGNYLLEEEFALFETEQGPLAVTRTCTHLGCRLDFSEAENLLVCPCHQSKFTIAGLRLDGPARRDLAVYPVEKLQGEKSGYIVTL